MITRRYSSNLSFVDMLFNLLVGFTSLFILAFLLINPIADEGKIDPVTQLMITLKWDPDLPPDLDIHVKTPNGDTVSFRRKDNNWMVLDRDDLGSASDFYTVNGETLIVQKNVEVVSVNAIVPGEYVVNVHFYGCGGCQTFVTKGGDKTRIDNMSYEVEIIDMHPFKIMYSVVKTDLRLHKEQTVVTFVVDEEGNIKDIRTDIFIPLFAQAGSPG